MTYPTPMDVAEAEDREADGLEFVCEECEREFVIPFDEYRGQFDHPPSVPICPECAEKESQR